MALVIGGALCVATSVAGAQRHDDIPQNMQPTAGMCRVWVDGVPAWRQRPQTDCDSARRTAPPNARILWGPHTSGAQNDPRRGQNVGNYDSRNDRWSISERERVQRARLERERIERERKREAWEREKLARERREREEERRRDAWRRSHHDSHDNRNDDDRRPDRRNDGSSANDPRKSGTRQ